MRLRRRRREDFPPQLRLLQPARDRTLEDTRPVLAEASPKGYKLKSSFKVPIGGNGWPHPVIYDGKLYLRGADQILCYDIKRAAS